MKQFFAFVHKEFLHILRDRRTVLILIGMPIVQILLFGFAISTEVRNIHLAVYDQSRDPQSRQLVEQVAANSYFSFVDYADNFNQIEQHFRDGSIDLALVLGPNFASDLQKGTASIQILSDATDPNTAQASTAYAQSIIQNYIQAMIQPSSSAVTPPPSINIELKLLYNPQMVAAYNFVPGVMGLILMLVCAMMTAIAIVREKEQGTMEVLLASPMRPMFIILAKVTPYFVLSCVNVVTILLLAVTVFKVPIAGSLFWLAIFCMVFVFTALALGILVSSLVKSQMAAMMISGMAFMMPTTILSGLMFPIESMPTVLQYVSNIIPATWFISGIRKIMIQGVEIQFAAKELIILCAMATLLTIVSLKKFKKRLQ